jgi:nitrogen fixation/metabolism regulation signal transduction histidine kinase
MIRVAICFVLAIVVVQLLATTHLYATAIVLVGLCAVAVHDLRRLMERAKREIRNALAEESIQQTPDRLKSERQLQYTEALLDTVTAALLVIREDGTVVLANRSARRLAGQPVSTLHEIAALGGTTASLLQSMQPGARRVAYLADGQPVYVSATEFRGAGNGGKQRLISLQRIAGELDAVEIKAWQDVASVLTHEMMNSLTPIASLSENLEQLLRDAQQTKSLDPTSIEVSAALEAIKRRSQGLMSFVERYRAVAELPAPDLQPVDLERLFAGVDRLMSPMLREAGVAYQRRSESPAPSILADADLLEQAIINLIRNAAEAAAEADGPAVTVDCELRDGEWVIAVADNGQGLNEQQRERIFVPFYTTKPDGSGIGLSLARQIAFAHRGRIDVEPNDPSGAVFSIVLPVAPSALQIS